MKKTQVYCYKLYLNQFNIIFISIIHSLFNRFNIYIERYKQINIFKNEIKFSIYYVMLYNSIDAKHITLISDAFAYSMF